MVEALPIEAVIGDLRAAVAARGVAVLEAPPGAGKTTRVPLALLPDIAGRILMLEPRRVAARAAAERMAETLGEEVGATVGYRIRGEARTSRTTRIEVVTEGILTRMLQRDPELPGIGLIIFDEFHERALTADLGLALALEVRAALRPDLKLLVMSATLETGPVAGLLGDAPVIRSEGRSHPVDLRWEARPVPPAERRGPALTRRVAAAVGAALEETDGGILVFLPGVGEIGRAASALSGLGVPVLPLHGGLPIKAQRAALRPAAGRRVVLATAIAETSVTLPDIRAVVDAGLARRARFDPATGMGGLVTERVSRAEAAQRAGRAGRVAPGICYRLWARLEEGALAPHAPPEIEVADLAALALELAVWGSDALPFLTPPPPARLAEGRALLAALGALDGAGRVTAAGREMAGLPVHPRLAAMLLAGRSAGAGRLAAELAALIEARDPMREAGADLSPRLAALRRSAGDPALAPIRAEAKRLSDGSAGGDISPGALLSLAYPDRIGMRRAGEAPRYLLSGGRGAVLPPGDGLGAARLIVAADLDLAPGAAEAVVRRALTLEEGEVRALHGARIETHRTCRWSRRHRAVEARVEERLDALTLTQEIWRDAPEDALGAALAEGIRDLGLPALPWTSAAERFRARLTWAAAAGADVPPADDRALLATLEDWLLPHATGVRRAAEFGRIDLLAALEARLDWPARQALDRAAPAQWTAPTGTRVPIDYSGEAPAAAVRLQEVFGLTAHPVVAGRPLLLHLLSPAGRPVQVTADLPGFWATSYGDVRRDMRGRYPKHPWPEDGAAALPVRGTGRRR